MEADSGAEDVCEEPPTAIDPYDILEIARDASEDAVKKAYRKLALKHHPDKASEQDKDIAKTTFQRLAFAYAILSDPARRSRYDATGSTSESILDAEGDDFDWLSFYRSQFENVVTEERVHKFRDEYKHSDEERDDLLAAYKKYEGDMDKIYQTVMLSNVLEDDGRFRNTIEDAIEAGEVESFANYTEESDKSKANRVKRAKNEARAAEREKKELVAKKGGKAGKGAGGDDDLAALIASNQAKRGGFLEQIEAKYGGAQNKRKKIDEPPEEAFAKNAKRGKKAKA